MQTVKCDKCGHTFGVEGVERPQVPGWPGSLVSDGMQWSDEDCTHCHFCLYEECEVFLRHSRWLCKDCRP